MKHYFCKLSKQDLHYLEAGKGENLVLLPSLWVTSKSYENIGDVLSLRYRVIIPDLYKGKSKFIKPACNLDDYSFLLNKFLKKIKVKKYYLIGISGSGFIATHFTNKSSRKPEKLLLFSTSFISADILKNRIYLIIKGYIKLLLNNFFMLQGIKVDLLWICDSVSSFVRHPRQFMSEASMSLDDQQSSLVSLVPIILCVAKSDEFIDHKQVLEKNKSVKNLKVILVEEKHGWFFVKPKIFLEKVNDFLRL